MWRGKTWDKVIISYGLGSLDLTATEPTTLKTQLQRNLSVGEMVSVSDQFRSTSAGKKYEW